MIVILSVRRRFGRPNLHGTDACVDPSRVYRFETNGAREYKISEWPGRRNATVVSGKTEFLVIFYHNDDVRFLVFPITAPYAVCVLRAYVK